MIRKIIFLLPLLVWSITYAQNDTLYLKKHYVILKGKKYNQTDSLGHKYGQWLSYGLKGGSHQLIHSDGELWSESFWYQKIYRPLELGEYYGIRKKISEKVDSVKGLIRINSFCLVKYRFLTEIVLLLMVC